MRMFVARATLVAVIAVCGGAVADGQIPSNYPPASYYPNAGYAAHPTPVGGHPGHENYLPSGSGQPSGYDAYSSYPSTYLGNGTPAYGSNYSGGYPRPYRQQEQDGAPQDVAPQTLPPAIDNGYGQQPPYSLEPQQDPMYEQIPNWNGQPYADPYGYYPQGGRPHYFDAMPGMGYGDMCGACGGMPCHCNRRTGRWVGGLGGLIMERDYESNVYLSYYPADPRNNILTSRSAELGSIGGYEAFFGRRMCNGWTWMASYWGLDNQSAMASATGMPDTRLYGMQMIDYTPQGFGADNVWNWFNNSMGHRITRENEFHNLELNFFKGGICSSDACGPYGTCNSCNDSWQVRWLAGARFFKFDEFFQYASSFGGGYVLAPREVYYDIETENNLVGVQIGGDAERHFGGCWTVFAGTKMGVFNNRVEHYSRIYGPSGNAVINGGSYSGWDFNSRSRKDDLAFVGEFNMGMHYRFSKCWRATLGYRVMAATGIALAPDQIPHNFSYLPGVNYIDSDGSLVLHGAYLGIELRR